MFDQLEFRQSVGSDNHSGVHPKVMAAMVSANRGGAHAYGLDELSSLTQREFARVFGEAVQAEYVFTGTAANVLCLAPLLRSFEAVIASEQSHLHVDECAAPEKFLGAKLYTILSQDGKITPEQALPLLQRAGDQHYAQPKVVSLTQPTELGVTYSLDELRAWREFCRAKNLMLHIDGARLANAAAHLGVSIKDITQFADVVALGGTKNGLMGAEACLLLSEQAKTNFKFYRKQAMQLSSKTRFLAAQFYAYLKDDLYMEIAHHTTLQAKALARALGDFPSIELVFPVESNALFVQLPKAWVAPLKKNYFFYMWDPSTQLCRWMIGFDWQEKDTLALTNSLKEVKACFPVK